MNDNIRNIRLQLLWDTIRTVNTGMPEAMFQAMKAMPTDEWVQTWFVALEGKHSKEDLYEVHEMLWPTTTSSLNPPKED